MAGGVGTLTPIKCNIEDFEYKLKSQIVAKHFLEKPIISRTTKHQHTVPSLHKSGKLLRKSLV